MVKKNWAQEGKFHEKEHAVGELGKLGVPEDVPDIL